MTSRSISKPVFISHVGARALWQSKRLAADELLTACAEKGGVIGVEAAPHTTLTEKHRKHSIDSFMEQFDVGFFDRQLSIDVFATFGSCGGRQSDSSGIAQRLSDLCDSF